LATVKKIFCSETAWSFLALTNQKQELLLEAIFVGQMERNEETL
jgi:hypothetical protein